MTDFYEEITKGDAAKQILDSEVFKEFCRIYEEGLQFKRLQNRGDAQAVQVLAMQEGAYFDFRELLEEFVTTGKMARMQMDEG